MANRSSTKFSIRLILFLAAISAVISVGIYIHYYWQDKKTELRFEEAWYDRFTLKNGMEVVVIPNNKIPAVSHMVWYKVGAMDESLGKSGIAHFLEHLMFKGTKKYRDGAFSKIVAQNGGKENAFTGQDYTAYFQNISKEKLPLVMELEADRMKNLVLSEDDVEKELQVIIEERRMRTDNEPRSLLAEQINAALFQNHPYQKPVIGWMHEMEGLTREDALNYYKTFYAPNNAILVLAGDVTMDEAEYLAKKYYGSLKKSDLPKRLKIEEPPQRVERRLVLEDSKVTDPEIFRSYYAPSINYGETENYYPLVVLSKIMGEGNISRLYQNLVVKKKLATMAGSYYPGIARGPADFSLYAIPAANVSMKDLEAAINEEIADIVKNGVTDDELAYAKKTLVADQIYAKEGLQSMAYAVGELMAVGQDPDYITSWPDNINSVTADEVKAAAELILKKQNSVTGILKNGN